jgi:hypothetical protein
MVCAGRQNRLSRRLDQFAFQRGGVPKDRRQFAPELRHERVGALAELPISLDYGAL